MKHMNTRTSQIKESFISLKISKQTPPQKKNQNKNLIITEETSEVLPSFGTTAFIQTTVVAKLTKQMPPPLPTRPDTLENNSTQAH